VFKMPPPIVPLSTSIASAAPPLEAVIAPVLRMPPPTELPLMKRAAVDPSGPTPAFPGAIVPAFVTAPVTVEAMITNEVRVWPAGFVTVATVSPLIDRPPAHAGAGAARRRARWWRGVKRER
jgi:hypothetical protein